MRPVLGEEKEVLEQPGLRTSHQVTMCFLLVWWVPRSLLIHRDSTAAVTCCGLRMEMPEAGDTA